MFLSEFTNSSELTNNFSINFLLLSPIRSAPFDEIYAIL